MAAIPLYILSVISFYLKSIHLLTIVKSASSTTYSKILNFYWQKTPFLGKFWSFIFLIEKTFLTLKLKVVDFEKIAIFSLVKDFLLRWNNLTVYAMILRPQPASKSHFDDGPFDNYDYYNFHPSRDLLYVPWKRPTSMFHEHFISGQFF